MPLTLVINGTVTNLPTDKAWSLSYAPDPAPTPTPAPVTELAAAIAGAKPGETIRLDKKYAYSSKAIRVTTPDLVIEGNGAQVQFNAEGKKDAGLFTLAGVKGFTLHDLDVIGNAKESAASYVVRSEKASDIVISKVRTFKHSDGSGSGIAVCAGVDGIGLIACSTEFTTVYSFYCGGSQTELNNKNISLVRCVWGKTNSHNMRTYGVKDMTIDECMFNNPDSKRQCIKVMNGENVTIGRSDFDGTTRFGRDIADPTTYTLKNCVIEDCNFLDWTRVDPTGGNPVTYRRCHVHSNGDSFCFHLFDKTILEDVAAVYQTGSGGRLANSSKLIVSQKGVTFNGKAV